MVIKVVNYALSASPLVQAFVAVMVDDWLLFHGLNYLRDGTLRSAQLTPWRRDGRRLFFDAVEILDADLRELLTADILAAIRTHVDSLPPNERVRAPRLSTAPPQVVAPGPPPTKRKQALPPPGRLLAGAKEGRP